MAKTRDKEEDTFPSIRQMDVKNRFIAIRRILYIFTGAFIKISDFKHGRVFKRACIQEGVCSRGRVFKRACVQEGVCSRGRVFKRACIKFEE